ncbi:MAG: hypothetical protein L3J59_09645 [Methylococcaceae bacterium]|nr:hypothetical protein [Methylococcaceae bacterium]
MNIKILVYFSFLFFMGCPATHIPYEPQVFPDISRTMNVLKETLSYQVPKRIVRYVEIKPDYFKVISGVRSTLTYIYFDDIQKIDLHEKRKRKVVTIWGDNHRALYRLYVKDQAVATDFINAVHTLKNHRKEIELELNKSIDSTKKRK